MSLELGTHCIIKSDAWLSLGDLIITCSKAARNHVLENTKLSDDRVVCIYDGISESAKDVSTNELEEIKKKFGINHGCQRLTDVLLGQLPISERAPNIGESSGNTLKHDKPIALRFSSQTEKNGPP